MMILVGDTEHGYKIARRAGIGYDPGVDHVISLANNYALLGGVVYTNYTGRTVQMHMAGFRPAWPTPHFMWAIYDFPFNYLKVEKVIGTVPSTNHLALEIDRKMGFHFEATIPDIVPGGDMFILSMRRHQCKYLKLASRYAVKECAA